MYILIYLYDPVLPTPLFSTTIHVLNCIYYGRAARICRS